MKVIYSKEKNHKSVRETEDENAFQISYLTRQGGEKLFQGIRSAMAVWDSNPNRCNQYNEGSKDRICNIIRAHHVASSWYAYGKSLRLDGLYQTGKTFKECEKTNIKAHVHFQDQNFKLIVRWQTCCVFPNLRIIKGQLSSIFTILHNVP